MNDMHLNNIHEIIKDLLLLCKGRDNEKQLEKVKYLSKITAYSTRSSYAYH